MKNAKKIFNAWFWTWFGIAIVMTVVMLAGGGTGLAKGAAAVIIATFMLLPFRNWLNRFTFWAIEYIASRRSEFRKRIHKYATMNTLLDSDNRESNVGFYRSLMIVIWCVVVILALSAMVFQDMSYSIVYNVLHTIEFAIRGKIGFIEILIYFLANLGFVFMIYKAIGWILNDVVYDNNGHIIWPSLIWRACLFLFVFYGRIILKVPLLKFTNPMVTSDLIFWSLILWIPFGVYEIWSHWPAKKDDDDDDDNSDDDDDDDDDNDDNDDDDVVYL